MEKNHGSKDKRAAPQGKSQKGKKEMGKCEFYVKKNTRAVGELGMTK